MKGICPTVMSPAATACVASWSVNMQWAAVTTYLLATSVPPQNWLPLERRATTQGYLFFYEDHSSQFIQSPVCSFFIKGTKLGPRIALKARKRSAQDWTWTPPYSSCLNLFRRSIRRICMYLQGWPRYRPQSWRISSLRICRLEIFEYLLSLNIINIKY